MTEPPEPELPAAEGMGRCEVCGEPVPTLELIRHLALLHPDVYEPVELWPDGRPVVLDTTLEPEEFVAEEALRWRTIRITRLSADRKILGEPLMARVDPVIGISECGVCSGRLAYTELLVHLRDDHPELLADVATVNMDLLDEDFPGGAAP